MAKKIFIIHSMGMSDKALQHAEILEQQGHDTYVPCRDTKQKPDDGFKGMWEGVILNNNLKGIKWADECHLIWDLSSLGSIFDLGSAYALDKPIYVVETKTHHWVKFIEKNVGKRML